MEYKLLDKDILNIIKKEKIDLSSNLSMFTVPYIFTYFLNKTDFENAQKLIIKISVCLSSSINNKRKKPIYYKKEEDECINILREMFMEPFFLANKEYVEEIIKVMIENKKTNNLVLLLEEIYLNNTKENNYLKIDLESLLLKIFKLYLYYESNLDIAIKWYRIYYSYIGGKENTKNATDDYLINEIYSSFNNNPLVFELLKTKYDKEFVDIYKKCSEVKVSNDEINLINLCNKYIERIPKIKKDFEKEVILYLMNKNIIDKFLISNIYFSFKRKEKDILKEHVYMYIKTSRNKYLKIIDKTQYLEKKETKKIVACINCVQNVIKIKETLLVKSNEKISMAYYTSINNLLRIFSSMYESEDNNKRDDRKLSLMNVSYMNDPNEGKAISKYLFDEETKKSNKREKLKNQSIYLKCFTPKIDDIPMWEMYGDHAKGCCIIFDSSKKQLERMELYKVCYINKVDIKNPIVLQNNKNFNEEEIKNLSSSLLAIRDNLELIDKKYIEKLIHEILYLFKDADYCHEQETRIIKANPNNSSIKSTKSETPILYVDADFEIKIKEIIIGPKCNCEYTFLPYIQEQIKNHYIETENKPFISKSQVSYR